MPILKNSKREILLAALLANPTVRAAAEAAGVPETTAFTWLRNPDFADEYKQRKRQAVAEASDFLQSRINLAVQIITEIMSDDDVPPQTRLNAAKTIVDTAYRVVEQSEIVARIEALEAIAGDNGR